MSDQSCRINLSDIDPADDRYKIDLFSTPDITFLARSIKEAGLTTPPVVRPGKNGFIAVTGFNRIRACLLNNEKKIDVYQTDPDITDYLCLLKSITARSFQRPLTHCELIICAKRLYQFLDIAQMAEKSSAVFNIELNQGIIKELLSVGTLPDPALELLYHGNLSFAAAKRLTRVDTDTASAFLSLFGKINASTSKQLEILLHIKEISSRDKISLKDLFDQTGFQAIVFDQAYTPGQKTDLLRAWLYDLRFPTLSLTQKQVQKKIAALKLDTHIKLIPPQNFESREYAISFTAKNFNELKKNADRLVALLQKKELIEIFKP